MASEPQQPDTPTSQVDVGDPERVRQDLARLQRLLELNKLISVEQDLDRLLEIVMDAVIDTSSAKRGFLILLGDDGSLENAHIVSRNLDGEVVRHPGRSISTGIAEQVIGSGQAIMTGNAKRDSRFARHESVRMMRLSSVLCFPLTVSESVIGAVYIDDPNERDAFSERDIEILSTFADPAAIALQNAQLHRQATDHEHALLRSNERLRGLIETSRGMMAERDLDRLLEMITHRATRITESERSTLFLLDETRRFLVSKVAEQVAEIRVSVDCGIAGEVATSRRTCNICDAYASARFDRSIDESTGFVTRNILAAPLLAHDDSVLGVIEVVNKADGSFTAYDEDLLEALAAQAAAAIENHLLFGHYRKKQKIDRDLKLARRLQALLLPDAPPAIQGLEISAVYQSLDETGGDYYDFFLMAPDKLAIVVADVSGHGISAALSMATARASLRAFMQTLPDLPAVISQLNATLVRDTELDRFMTLFLCVIDLANGEVTYTNAGHAIPLFYRATTGEFLDLDVRGMPLGVLKAPRFGEAPPVSIVEGDVILLMTDGVWEAFDEQEQEFGRERVSELVQQHAGHPACELVSRIHEKVTAYCHPLPISDDFTIIAIRRTAGTPTEHKPLESPSDDDLPMA